MCSVLSKAKVLVSDSWLASNFAERARDSRRTALRGSPFFLHMEAACTEAMRQPGVIGVMCVDGQGLRLQSQGEVPEVSGCVAEIVSQAQVLCQGDEGAVVSVESAERKVLLSRFSGVTTAIFMRPSGVA